MKKLLVIFLVLLVVLSMIGCNRQIIDTTWSYESAMVKLPNGDIVEGKITSWTDYENSDMLQIKIDGKQYLTHSTNVVLISN